MTGTTPDDEAASARLRLDRDHGPVQRGLVFQVPWGTLILCLIVAAIVGVLAGVWPAWRPFGSAFWMHSATSEWLRRG
jgi:hypothetical protein